MLVGSIADAARVYHLGYEILDESQTFSKAIYEQVFQLEKEADSAIAFLHSVAEQNLHTQITAAPFLQTASQRLELLAGRYQPHLIAHDEGLSTTLNECKTPTEVLAHARAYDERLKILTMWCETVLQFAFRPVVTLLYFEAEPTQARRTAVANSYSALRAGLGVNWTQLWSCSYIQNFFRHELFAWLNYRGDDHVTPAFIPGEAGTSLRRQLAGAESAYILHAMEQGEDLEALTQARFKTPADAQTRLTALLVEAEQQPDLPVQPPTPLQCFGELVSWEHLNDDLALFSRLLAHPIG